MRTLFPSLFAIATSKEAWACDAWEQAEFRGCWNSRFVRNFQDWELSCVEALLLWLHSKSVSREVDNKVVWMATKGGQFSVKSFYDGMVMRSSNSFLARLIWNSWAPIKVNFFCLGNKFERDSNCRQLEEGLDFGEQMFSTQRQGGILQSHPSSLF